MSINCLCFLYVIRCGMFPYWRDIMRRFRLVVLAFVCFLLSGCLYDSIIPDTATITIYNPSSVDVNVKCFFFRDSEDIIVPAFGSAEAVVCLRDTGEPVNLYTTSRYHMTTDSNIEVEFNPYGMYCVLKPDVSWIKVMNTSDYVVEDIMFTASKTGLVDTAGCYWNEEGEPIGKRPLAPGDSGYIMFREGWLECKRVGWLRCRIGNHVYVTQSTIRSPSAGHDSLQFISNMELVY